MSYSTENPGHGNTSEINGFATNQTSRVTHCADVSSRVTAILNSEAAASWQAAAATAWRDRMARVIPTLDAAGTVAHGWAAAAQTYQGRLTTMTSQAAVANHDINTGHSMLHAYSQMPPEITSTPQYVAKTHAYEADIREGHQTLHYLESLRYGDDATCVYALNARGAAGAYSNWLSLQAIYGDAKTVDDIRDARVAAIAEANRLADAVEAARPDVEDIDALARLLGAMSVDPTLAGDFWSGRGGDDALTLMQAGLEQHMNPGGMGFPTDEDEAAALAFARSIRDSIAAGSNTWDDQTARDFAARMVTGDDWPGQGSLAADKYQGIAFLFDDSENNPMGVKFTVATADLLDAWERAEGEPGVPRGITMCDPNASQAWFGDIAYADQKDRGGYDGSSFGDTAGHPTLDPMGRVFDTLALYPDSAWEWFSADGANLANGSPAIATDKVGYYASRDWTADGWDGFGSLWESSMHAEGGFLDGPPNTATWDAQCDVAARVVDGLGGDASLISPDALSSSGAEKLGVSLAHLMPMIAEELTSQSSPSYDSDLRMIDERTVAGFDSPIDVPTFSDQPLGRLLGSVMSSNEGFAPVAASVALVEQNLIAHADAVGGFEAWNRAIETYAVLQGNLDGAVGGVDVLEARLQDADVRARMELFGDVAGLLPGVKLEGLAGTAVNFGLGQAESSLIGAMTDALASNETAAIDLAHLSTEGGRASLELKIAILERTPELSFDNVAPDDQSRAQWIDTLITRYDDAAEARLWNSTT